MKLLNGYEEASVSTGCQDQFSRSRLSMWPRREEEKSRIAPRRNPASSRRLHSWGSNYLLMRQQEQQDSSQFHFDSWESSWQALWHWGGRQWSCEGAWQPERWRQVWLSQVQQIWEDQCQHSVPLVNNKEQVLLYSYSAKHKLFLNGFFSHYHL